MELEKLLAQIAEDMKSLREREQKGENVKDEIDALEKKQADLEAQIKALNEKTETKEAVSEPLSGDERGELQRLREADQKSREEATAKAVAVRVVEQIRTDTEAEAKRIETIALKAAQDLLGGKVNIDEAVKAALEAHPGTSRFVNEYTSEDAVKHVQGGGHLQVVERRGGADVRVGADREIDALNESKSFAKLMLAMTKNANRMATDLEVRWLTSLQEKALAEGTGSAGGFLVPSEWMPDILGLLRARAIVRRAGPREVPFNKIMYQTSVASGATAYYLAENAQITASEPAFAEATLLTPKNLACLVPVSNYLLADADQAESMIRNDMVEVMALKEDYEFLLGDGLSQNPKGFRQITGVTLNPISLTPYPDGFEITLPQIRRIKAAYRTQNAPNLRLAWFFHPSLLTHLETLTDADGRFLADANILRINDDQISGTLDGVPFFTSTQLPANLTQGASSNATDILLINMNEAVLGINQDLELAVSSEASYNVSGTWHSAFQQNQTIFRSVMRHDINHRRPAQVIVQAGVLV